MKIDGKYGYIGTSGNIAIAPQFEEADQFSQEMATVKIGGKWGYIRHRLID